MLDYVPTPKLMLGVGYFIDKHFEYIHLLKHAEQIKQKGYDVMDYINHILNTFTQVYSQQTASKPNKAYPVLQ